MQAGAGEKLLSRQLPLRARCNQKCPKPDRGPLTQSTELQSQPRKGSPRHPYTLQVQAQLAGGDADHPTRLPWDHTASNPFQNKGVSFPSFFYFCSHFRGFTLNKSTEYSLSTYTVGRGGREECSRRVFVLLYTPFVHLFASFCDEMCQKQGLRLFIFLFPGLAWGLVRGRAQ